MTFVKFISSKSAPWKRYTVYICVTALMQSLLTFAGPVNIWLFLVSVMLSKWHHQILLDKSLVSPLIKNCLLSKSCDHGTPAQ